MAQIKEGGFKFHVHVYISQFRGVAVLKKALYLLIVSSAVSLSMIVLQSGCSHEISSYDEIEMDGKIESIVRKHYSGLFKAIKRFEISSGKSEEEVPDSSLIKKAAQLTDKLIEDIRPFPSTLESRIALDALSYAANDLAKSPDFPRIEISEFWRNALLIPLFSFGYEFIKSGKTNESAHLQIIKAIHRGMSTKATEEMLIDSIPIVGVAPSQKVMEFCKTDTLFFKKIHDLILYTKSLQKYDPPIWMLSGSWFLTIEFNGLPTIFISLKPFIIDDVPYLSFMDYNQGEIYSAVFDDPIPSDNSKWDTWLVRANTIMSSLTLDNSFAERVRNSGLSTYDAHTFFDEYLLHTDADTTKKEFWISFMRNKVEESAFQFTGMDSIAVKFNSSQITKPDSDITKFPVTRVIGASMKGNQFYPSQTLEGTAYLMPLGTHDNTKIDEYQKAMMPKIEITTVSPDN